MRIDRTAKTPTSFWSYQAPPTPSYDEAKTLGAIGDKMTETGWESLTPGMRREIVRSHLKRTAQT